MPSNPKKIFAFIITILAIFYLIEQLWSSQTIYWSRTDKLALGSCIITFVAFIAAGWTIWQQHKSLEQQIIDSKKQETIAAWQILTTKAPGNSGKIEAMEFLAKQGKSLDGINMSKDTHHGEVYLIGLNLEGLDGLRDTNFSYARLIRANFRNTILLRSKFIESDLREADFTGSCLDSVDFSDACLEAYDGRGSSIFGDNYVYEDKKRNLPIFSEKYPFKFEFAKNSDGTKKLLDCKIRDNSKPNRDRYLIVLEKITK